MAVNAAAEPPATIRMPVGSTRSCVPPQTCSPIGAPAARATCTPAKVRHTPAAPMAAEVTAAVLVERAGTGAVAVMAALRCRARGTG
jgi:hypothetical protein